MQTHSRGGIFEREERPGRRCPEAENAEKLNKAGRFDACTMRSLSRTLSNLRLKLSTPRTPSAAMNVSISIPRPECTLFIPIEVCENIIDMMYSAYFSEELGNFAALRNCSLVCRAWSIRAQKVLFYTVHLPDTPSVYRFAAVLQAARRLGSFVHEVTLIGRSLHTTASVLSLFPAVFAGKLPNLQELYITHVLESDAWYPTGSDSPKAKPLPYVPLHSCFSAVLSTFTAPSTLLHLDRITFCSFSEFARMVHALPNLEELRCYSIKWITLGRLPSFMAYDRRRHFAPKLQTLEVCGSRHPPQHRTHFIPVRGL